MMVKLPCVTFVIVRNIFHLSLLYRIFFLVGWFIFFRSATHLVMLYEMCILIVEYLRRMFICRWFYSIFHDFRSASDHINSKSQNENKTAKKSRFQAFFVLHIVFITCRTYLSYAITYNRSKARFVLGRIECKHENTYFTCTIFHFFFSFRCFSFRPFPFSFAPFGLQ